MDLFKYFVVMKFSVFYYFKIVSMNKVIAVGYVGEIFAIIGIRCFFTDCNLACMITRFKTQ